MKIAIVYETVSDKDFFQPFKTLLASHELVDVCYRPTEPEAFIRAMVGVAGMLCRSYLEVPEAWLTQLPALKVISNTGTGFNPTMLKGTKAAGISLCAIREFSTNEVADHTCLLILALMRWLIPFQRAIQDKKIWDFSAYAGAMPGLTGRTLGICGFGRIGQAVARRMKGFGVNIVAYDPFLNPALAAAQQVALVSFEELLASSDIITNHMNQTDNNHGIFARDTFLQMQKRPIFINCGRGAAVNEGDLLRALERGDISAAGLDVLADEQPDLNGKYASFLGRDNLLLTPHVGYFSDDSTAKMVQIATANLTHALAGDYDRVDHVVNGVIC